MKNIFPFTIVALVSAGLWMTSGDADACTIWQVEDGLDLHFSQDIPLPYYIQEDGCSDIDDGSEFEAIQNAFTEWASVECNEGGSPALLFAYKGTVDTDPVNFDPRFFRDEKNMVSFIKEGWEGDPGVVARARVLWDSETGEVREFGIGLNDQYADWSTADAGFSGSFDVQSVMMRQIGLILGLGDSEVEASAMYPGLMTGSVSRRVLDNDDVVAICELYLPGRDYSAEVAEEDQLCGHELHPGARPPEPNNSNPGNNSSPNNSNDNNSNDNNDNSGNNDPDPGPMNLGAGVNCAASSECADGLICGCPFESCDADICYEFIDDMDDEGEPVEEEGCATAPGRGSSGVLWFALLALGFLWRGRSSVSGSHS